jgi:PleD family two-component response regulator
MSEIESTQRPPLVLIANDQEWSARSLESILAPSGFAVLRAYTGKQALDIARTSQPDVIILDWKMADVDGITICRRMREEIRLSGSTPIIMTSSTAIPRSQRIAAHEAGAWEFCGHPLDTEVLVLKLRSFVRAKLEADRLSTEHLIDSSTGLYNMRGLARRAREIGAEAFRGQDALACVAFSPDAAPGADEGPGDERAVQIAAHLGEICRRTGRLSDAIGCMGPMQFAVVAPRTEGKGALRLIERFRRSIQDHPLSIDGLQHPMQIRAGYCAVPNFTESPIDAIELLLRASTALRYSRAEGSAATVRSYDDLPAAAYV